MNIATPQISAEELALANSAPPVHSTRLSFRDPEGQLFKLGERLFRLLRSENTYKIEQVLKLQTIQKLRSEGQFVETRILPEKEALEILKKLGSKLELPFKPGLVLEHQQIPFVNYPHEWSAEMLYKAGELTLKFNLDLLEEGYGLKDASAHNIVFNGPNPVFVDFLSIEKRLSTEPHWMAFGQFVRNFLIPLLLNRYFSIPLSEIFLNHRDGLEPEQAYPLCSFWQRWRQPFFSLITLPNWLSQFQTSNPTRYQSRPIANPKKALFILKAILKQAQRSLTQLKPDPTRKSLWSTYDSLPRPRLDASQKESFVEQFMQKYRPKTILDVGANAGRYATIAAKEGARVLALDSDSVVSGALLNSATTNKLNILPLVVDLARPSPALGWCNGENSAFLKRATDSFDAVFLLAVMHHITLREGIPLAELINLLAQLSRSFLIIEFIGPTDEVSVQLGQRMQVEPMQQIFFEQVLAKRFETLAYERLKDSDRHLYLLKKYAWKTS